MDEAPLRRRLGCWGWILGAVGCCGVGVFLGLCWLSSAGDLDVERERAVAMGLPMSWADLGLDRPAGPDRDILSRADRLDTRIVDYYGISPDSLPFPATADFVAWDAEQRTTHPGTMRVLADEIDRLVDQLSGSSSMGVDVQRLAKAIDAGDANQIIDNILALRDQREFILERYSQPRRPYAGHVDPIYQADRLARLACSMHTVTSNGHAHSLRATQLWIQHVLKHRDHLEVQHTIGVAQQLTKRLEEGLSHVIAAEPLILDVVLRLPAERMLKAISYALPPAMCNRAGMIFFHRSGRAPILARAIDTALWCRRQGLPTTCAQAALASPDLPPATILHEPFSSVMEGHVGFHHVRVSVMRRLLLEHLRIATHLRLLAAALDGSAWPCDPGDPTGCSLREIHREGRLIGAYSVGPDGRDDGSDVRNDWCFALHEELGSPKASGPPPKP